MDEFFRFSCPACGNKLKAKPEDAGKRGHCACGHPMVVPSPRTGDGKSAGRHQSSRVVWPWFAGGSAILAVVIGLAVWFLIGDRKQSVVSDQGVTTGITVGSTKPAKPASETPGATARARSNEATEATKPRIREAFARKEAQKPEQPVAPKRDIPKGSENILDVKTLAEVQGNHSTAIVRTDADGQSKGIIVYATSKLWIELAEDQSENLSLHAVHLDEPESLLFIAEGGVEENTWSTTVDSSRSGTTRADIVLKYQSVDLFGQKSGLGFATFELPLFFKPGKIEKKSPALLEGRVYRVNFKKEPELVQEDLYSGAVKFQMREGSVRPGLR